MLYAKQDKSNLSTKKASLTWSQLVSWCQGCRLQVDCLFLWWKAKVLKLNQMTCHIPVSQFVKSHSPKPRIHTQTHLLRHIALCSVVKECISHIILYCYSVYLTDEIVPLLSLAHLPWLLFPPELDSWCMQYISFITLENCVLCACVFTRNSVLCELTAKLLFKVCGYSTIPQAASMKK